MNNPSDRFLVFIPTYNEAGNVELLIQELIALQADFDILFVDDNSPDGTGDLLDAAARKFPNLHVIHREGRMGIGGAHKAGIDWAYERGYRILVTMDADFTHPPGKIPELIAAAGDCDIAVGSRYLQKDGLAGWNPIRKLLTWTAHILTNVLLGLRYDSTGAFRRYRLDRIPQALFHAVNSNGYSFFFESLHLLNINHFQILEMPIALPPRTYGSSKMSYVEALRSLQKLFAIYFRSLLSGRHAPTPVPSQPKSIV